MRKRGRIVVWNDEKGFGFIETEGMARQAFVHASEFTGSGRRPVVGLEVSYRASRDSQGRLRADDVKIVGSLFSAGPATRAFLIALVFLLLVAAVVALGLLPLAVLWLYLGMSLLTFAVYAQDKSAAQKGARRTSEQSLHLCALLGGWPGALYAQQLLRHKSSKAEFRALFWVTVLLNVSAFGYLLTDYGTWLVDMLQRLLP